MRAFLVHGWGGGPTHDWFPWVKKELEKKGYEVIIPQLPDTEHPKIGPWVAKLSEVVGPVKKDDIFIGHSVGCLAILRFLKSLPKGQKVRRVILVALWQYLTALSEEDQEIARLWTEAPLDFEKVKTKADKFIAVFSDNDHFVPLKENLEFFKEKLKPEIIVKNKMAHFNEGHGIFEIPFLLELLK